MSADLLPVLDADVTFLTAAEGGREAPLVLEQDGTYRPHIVIGDPHQRRAVIVDGVIAEEYLGVEVCACLGVIRPGDTRRLSMRLAFHPAVEYQRAVPGATFTVREGGKVVAYGTIRHRSDPTAAAERRRTIA